MSTAGFAWSLNSWPYFLRHAGHHYFIWRTAWGERLVLGLDAGTASIESEQHESPLAAAMNEEAKRLARELLHGALPKLDRIARVLTGTASSDAGVLRAVRFLRQALHLADVHGLTDCVPLMLPWAQLDATSNWDAITLFGEQESVSPQGLRPLLYQSLRALGALPPPLPAYSASARLRFRLPRLGRWLGGLGDALRGHPESLLPVEERFARAVKLDRGVSARKILKLLGVPDCVTLRISRVGQRYQKTQDWHFDFRLPTGWQTLSITWEEQERRRRIKELRHGPSPWLHSRERDHSLLCPCFD
jgi:hypothetical protein